jgi:calcium/calmodulin-dependent protein kinase I
VSHQCLYSYFLLIQEFQETPFSRQAKESFFPCSAPPSPEKNATASSSSELKFPVTPQKTVGEDTGTPTKQLLPVQQQQQAQQQTSCETYQPHHHPRITPPSRTKKTSYVPPSPFTDLLTASVPATATVPATAKPVIEVPFPLVETSVEVPTEVLAETVPLEVLAEQAQLSAPTSASATSLTNETTAPTAPTVPPVLPERDSLALEGDFPPPPPANTRSGSESPGSLDLCDLENELSPNDLDGSIVIGDVSRKEQALTPHFDGSLEGPEPLDVDSDTLDIDAVVSSTEGLDMSEPQDAAAAAKEAARPSSPQYPIIPHSVPKDADTTPEPSSLSGMRFDELYRLKGVLGTGAFSTVRAGFHRSNTDISYAVKCINRKKLSEEDEAALLDEVAILKEMKHSSIIRLYDFFTEPATYYLVMERMRGGELFDRIVAKAYYNEKEARDTCKIVLEAVGYCHSNHVAHRDLKPENLLLLSEDDDSAVKIADFGFAKKVYEHNSLKTQCGTPGYVAPEILEGTPYDERADMWSVGVILYILLGGYPPFIESTQRDLFRKIRKGDYEFHEEYWGTVSTEAKELISSLLTVKCEDRLTASDAMENSWILGDDNKLAKRDLGANLEKFRNFNAKRKFRAAVATVMAVNKLHAVSASFFKSLHSNTDSSENIKIPKDTDTESDENIAIPQDTGTEDEDEKEDVVQQED